MSYTNGHFESTLLIDLGMNRYDLSELNCPNQIHSKYILYFPCGRDYTHPDSVQTGPARRHNQYTDCIYSHDTDGLHYNNKMILAYFI